MTDLYLVTLKQNNKIVGQHKLNREQLMRQLRTIFIRLGTKEETSADVASMCFLNEMDRGKSKVIDFCDRSMICHKIPVEMVGSEVVFS
jgi:hypothetical protein